VPSFGCLVSTTASGGCAWTVAKAAFSKDASATRREHQNQYPASLASFVERSVAVLHSFMNLTQGLVRSWPVHPAANADRVAVVIFQPASELRYFEYVIRSNVHRLGAEWALQIFYGRAADRRRLDRVLGRPANVIWTQIRLGGRRHEHLSYKEAQWFRLGLDFWGAIRPRHEHVLIFEADTLLLRGPGCVEGFFEFDYVGAPWHEFLISHLGYPSVGGNGGLSLRKRSKMLEVVRSRACNASRGPEPSACAVFEDEVLVRQLRRSNASLPPRATAAAFAVETIFHPRPCGFHKPWYYQEPDVMRHLLGTADFG